MMTVLLPLVLTCCSIAVMGMRSNDGAWNLMPYCATGVMLLGNLILIPVDEWAGDYSDQALENDSDVGRAGGIDRYLDIDSLYPRRNRAVVRQASGDEITAVLQIVAAGPAGLQAGEDQRLHFLAA